MAVVTAPRPEAGRVESHACQVRRRGRSEGRQGEDHGDALAGLQLAERAVQRAGGVALARRVAGDAVERPLGTRVNEEELGHGAGVIVPDGRLETGDIAVL